VPYATPSSAAQRAASRLFGTSSFCSTAATWCYGPSAARRRAGRRFRQSSALRRGARDPRARAARCDPRPGDPARCGHRDRAAGPGRGGGL